MTSAVDGDIKSALVRSLLADGSARRNLKSRFDRGARKAREALVQSLSPPKPLLTEARAALELQRSYRGHRARSLVRNWTRVVDDDGDIYWFNTKTGVSTWLPPTEEAAKEKASL